MLRQTAFAFSIIFMLSCNNENKVSENGYPWPKDVTPPVADKKPHPLTAHGDTRQDDYYWMNDYFKKGADSTAAVSYLEAENAYLDTMMQGTKELQNTLFQEMKGRIKETDQSVPALKNGYYYYSRSEEGQQYFKYCRKKGDLNAPEEILLDVDEMAKGHGYYSASGMAISPDNKWLAWGIDTVSRRQYVIHFKNLETGEIISESIPGTDGEPVWGNDNKTIFYTANNQVTLLSEKIRRHKLGTQSDEDITVYEEKDPENYIGVAKSQSDKYIFIVSRATMSSEVRYLNADQPTGSFTVFQPRMKDVLYSVENWEGKFVIRTNMDALNFRLMETPVTATGKDNWKDVVPHRSNVLIEGVVPFKNYWVITEREEGLLHFRVHDPVNNSDFRIPMQEASYDAYPGENYEYDSPSFRYYYTSLTTPLSTYDFNLKTHDTTLLKEQEVVGGYDKGQYKSERIYATAKDGTRVPISIVYKNGWKKDGSRPLLLYGYGSYGYSMDASFSSSRISLLDRGFAFAIAHIRGGQEMGRQWYEDGKMQKKINTFSDFIACGQYLVDQKFTSPEHLYAQGASAGGLLMGAVLNMAPELWHGVIAGVPFVDVVTTMSDPTIPLTTNEYDEWGNPADSASYFYMKSYSPYDNVKPQQYPNILVTTGLHDSQVQYFEPEKWVAKLRAMKTDHNILLLHTSMQAGHGGVSGRFNYLKNVALEYAFLLALENKVDVK